jgi:NADH-quinone oxidoreductase subunit G
MSAVPSNPATPPDHVNIEIDGQAMTAPKGAMIIHAADKAGIAIPRFCYHDKLPIAANCRMCLVDVEKAPKPMPACATPVMEGMKVYTQTKRALDSQRNVMEFLLINHPLDCPICDQGGECELQDVAMGYGRSVSRFTERKRVVPDEDVGPLVATDMTRCIHCTRCVRFVSEIAGTYELGGMSRGENLQIGTYIGKSIESELSGNIIDVCPVGALTNKPFRFRARAWELVARESIGYHDALGSNLFLHIRRGEVLRSVPRDNEAINETWLSDRDRYSHTGLRADDRLTAPMLRDGADWRPASWEEALDRAATLLKARPGDDLGVLLHPATSSEEGALLRRLAEGLACGNLDHRLRIADFADAPAAQPFELPLAEVETANAILLLGCNPRLEAPLLGHRVRKAWKRGAQVHAINPVEFDFNFELRSSRLVAPDALTGALLGLARAAGEGGSETPPAGSAEALASASVQDADRALLQSLREAGSAVVLLGESLTCHPQASWLRALAHYIARSTGARVNELPQGANAIGLAQGGVLPRGLDAGGMLAQPRASYLLYGIEPEFDFADAPTALRALGAAQQVVAFAAYASPALKAVAQVLLPLALLPESEGTLTNVDGLRQTVPAGARAPGEARPGWRVLRALGAQAGLAGFDFTDFAGAHAAIARDEPAPRSGGLAPRPAATPAEGALVRIATSAVYRADAVLRRAAPLNAHPLNLGPGITLHPEDALARGLAAGAIAKVDDGRGTAALPVRVSTRVPRGAAWVESGYAATAPLAGSGARLTVNKA